MLGTQILFDKDTTENIEYVGIAASGVSTSAAQWQIKAIETSGDDVISIKFAGGTADFDKNGNILELYGLPVGGVPGTELTMEQVRIEIAKNIGKGIQLGFNGTLENNILTFTPPIGSGIYTTRENYDYEIDLLFEAGGLIDDDVQMQIVNGSDVIQFWTIKDTPATWGDLKQLFTYSDEIGYRWLFKARYHVTTNGTKILYIFPTVNNAAINTQLYFNGNYIYDEKNGNQLNYNDIYKYISNKNYIVSVNYADSNVLYPAFWTGDAIEFTNILMIDQKVYATRLIINAQNNIKYEEIELALATN